MTYNSTMLGFIYIMSNPSLSGLLKIGQTGKDPLIRRKSLNTTGVPDDFVIEYQALIEDYRRQEKLIHQKLNKVRHSNKKEFFSTSVLEAINTIREQCGDKIKHEEVFYSIPEKLESVSKANDRLALNDSLEFEKSQKKSIVKDFGKPVLRDHNKNLIDDLKMKAFVRGKEAWLKRDLKVALKEWEPIVKQKKSIEDLFLAVSRKELDYLKKLKDEKLKLDSKIIDEDEYEKMKHNIYEEQFRKVEQTVLDQQFEKVKNIIFDL